MHIPTCNLLSRSHVNCVYDFRTEQLVLDNPFDVLLPGEDHAACSQLPLVTHSSLCKVEASGIFFPVRFGTSIGITLGQLTLGQSC